MGDGLHGGSLGVLILTQKANSCNSNTSFFMYDQEVARLVSWYARGTGMSVGHLYGVRTTYVSNN